MSKTHTNDTLNSLEALAVLLPSGTVIDPDTEGTAEALPAYNGPTLSESAGPLDDASLLGLASRLQQALQQWRTQLSDGAARDAQAHELERERERLEGELERSRARWRQQKGRHALQDLLDSLGSDVPCFDAETTRLVETARGALERWDRRLDASLRSGREALAAVTAQLEALEADPAVRLYRGEQSRQAEAAKWQQLLDQAQAGYRQARQVRELEAVQALTREIVLQAPQGAIYSQAEQLLVMVTTDVEKMRATEREIAERAARAGFGKWLKSVNRRRGADDLVLPFGIGQGVHVALTE
jgi:hypothetical protein